MKTSETINQLEESFSELNHVIGNKNLSNLILAEKISKLSDNLDILAITSQIAENCRLIAQAKKDFTSKFVEFRDNDYQ